MRVRSRLSACFWCSLVGAGAVGVAVGQHGREPSLFEVLRELGDSGRLPDAVDAGENDDDWLVGRGDPLLEVELADADDVEQRLPERVADQIARTGEPATGLADEVLLDALEDLAGDAHLDVAGEEREFEVVEVVRQVLLVDDGLARRENLRALGEPAA